MKFSEDTKTVTTVNITVPEGKAIAAIVANRLPALVLAVCMGVAAIVAAIRW